ncbi:GNAT family N-acetyltransferase [Clostridium sp. YIM B02515]|uniref:GNAT family N-acetyltransferase n=1 Tax=Clostridium rhizosphaerae TaxID=2803861 RepID=A0ABS1TGS6_9CLOT|nr:GNAT family N-acetyltransferase [Clostridium rhizosphaerae]MBL4938583.1 GNAT family N-acetyltransferase [Clostridium rhizosphaerae]
MLKLIRRNAIYVDGYKEYCQEFWDHDIHYFRPTNPALIDETWFERTKSWYDKKELGLISGQPVSFHYWAVDGDNFIGEFQLRTELQEEVMTGIGSIGYSVLITEQGKGYGTEILRQGLVIARDHPLERVLLTINDQNILSAHICEKLGGVLMDRIPAYNKDEGNHIMRRYWIYL